MGHLSEKEHIGVLTGSPITDVKITLAAGRAHLKHTEGGDFRQATYRAVRQGLRSARSVLLEPWYEMTQEDQDKIMAATEWCAADNGYFRGGGYSSRFLTRAEMPATMIRLNLVKGLGPTVQICEGYTVALPDEVSDIIWKRTDYTWPCTWFAPRCDGKEGSPFKTAYEVMMNWGANHGAISYGHIGADLITMCSMLRIPVCMHNVPEDQIYRPACWNAFGMDKEGQDYRACATYGPMYK